MGAGICLAFSSIVALYCDDRDWGHIGVSQMDA